MRVLLPQDDGAPSVASNSALRSAATPDPITGERRDRVVIRTEDLDEETLALIVSARDDARRLWRASAEHEVASGEAGE